MEKYATYDYFKNSETKEIKKIPLHDFVNSEEYLTKQGTKNPWIKITNKAEIKEIENKK